MSRTVAPRISEKAFNQAGQNVYTFVVPKNMNKHQIRLNVESIYEVHVTDVNVSVLKGKAKRFMQKRGRQSLGERQDVKKAYVVLKDGESIPFFAATEAEPKELPTTKGGK